MRKFITSFVIIVLFCCTLNCISNKKNATDESTTSTISKEKKMSPFELAAIRMKEIQGAKLGEEIICIKNKLDAFDNFKYTNGDTIYAYDYIAINKYCNFTEFLYLYWSSSYEIYGCDFPIREGPIGENGMPFFVAEGILRPLKQEVADFEEKIKLNKGEIIKPQIKEDDSDSLEAEWDSPYVCIDPHERKVHYEYLYRIIIKGDSLSVTPIRYKKCKLFPPKRTVGWV